MNDFMSSDPRDRVNSSGEGKGDEFSSQEFYCKSTSLQNAINEALREIGSEYINFESDEYVVEIVGPRPVFGKDRQVIGPKPIKFRLPSTTGSGMFNPSAGTARVSCPTCGKALVITLKVAEG